MNKKKKFAEIIIRTVLTPLAFNLIAVIICYAAVSPFVPAAAAVFGIFSIETPPSFGGAPESIFTGDLSNADSNSDIDGVGVGDGGEISLNPGGVDIAKITMPRYEQHYANLIIESLDIECKIYFGDSDTVLRHGAGQHMGSRLPGFGSPILIGAHVTTFFKRLGEIKEDAIVKIQTNHGTYEYKVFETKTAKYDDASAFDLDSDEEILVLYTCDSLSKISKTGYNSDRFFVYARKISGAAVIQ
ncbi:MAG: class D sortase [Oscillospiraceae bacterium]|nr:class D sortase [Oscillospiraceae bacterium]